LGNWKKKIAKEGLVVLAFVIFLGLIAYLLPETFSWLEERIYTIKMELLVKSRLNEWKPEEVATKNYPQIKALQQWNKDPEFRKLSGSERLQKYTEYFNQKLADEEFFKLPPEEQTRIRNNFFKSNIPDVTAGIIGTFKRVFPEYADWSDEDLERRLPELDYKDFPFPPSGVNGGLLVLIYCALFLYLLIVLVRLVVWSITREKSVK